MKRKLQVFVSSTYEDLRDERQAAVEAILKAGHIPAGMELFTAGSEPQLQVIRQWILESDIFVLILGGRYGSIEPKSGLSYTEVEFNYARSLNKPFFSIVVTQDALEERTKTHGRKILEQSNEEKLRTFRTTVVSQLCAFFSNPKDVKLAIFETIPQLAERVKTGGWIAAEQAAPSEDVTRQLTALIAENRDLRKESAKLQEQLAATSANTFSFDQISKALEQEVIVFPKRLSEYVDSNGAPIKTNVLHLAIASSDCLARGVSNSVNTPKLEAFLFYKVASLLASYGLVEDAKVPTSVVWQRLKLSATGVKFLTYVRLQMASTNTQLNGVKSGMESLPQTENEGRALPKPKKKVAKKSGAPKKRTS